MNSALSDASSAAVRARQKIIEAKKKEYVVPKFDFNVKEKVRKKLDIDEVCICELYHIIAAFHLLQGLLKVVAHKKYCMIVDQVYSA